VENVERTSTEADVIEHVIAGMRLPVWRLSGGDIVRFEFDLEPWLATFVTADFESRSAGRRRGRPTKHF
jgi:hypothetical protein